MAKTKEEKNQTENDVILNLKENTLYCNDVRYKEDCKYMNSVSDTNPDEIQISPRIFLQVLYSKKNNNLEQFKIIKLHRTKNENKEEISFSKFNLEHLGTFFDFLKNKNLIEITEKKLNLSYDDLDKNRHPTKSECEDFLQTEEGKKIVEEFIKNNLTDKDIITIGYRKKQLEIFKQLLNQKDYWQTYRDEENIIFTKKAKEEQKKLENAGLKINKTSKEEVTWQYFFAKNQWIFGYGLDYRFQGILQKEAQTSDGNHADGKTGSGVCDYLLADNKFISFVELKTPNTPLFGTSRNRSQCWRLNTELLDAYSQVLEHKASGQLHYAKPKLDNNNEIIKQKPIDVKVILIIGNWKEIENDDLNTKSIKEKTLELFRRDSRNIEIITFCELYERAEHIVKNSTT